MGNGDSNPEESAGGVVPVDSSDTTAGGEYEVYKLSVTKDQRELIDRFDAILPNVSLRAVVDDANRGGGASPTPGRPFPQFDFNGYWNDDDNDSSWYPQGITGSADAHLDGEYEGRKVLAVSWYDNLADEVNKGARVTFVDRTDSSDPVYRHVLLVRPYEGDEGNPNFKAVKTHAGGLAWYGNLLYVASTHDGIRVFDLEHLWRVSVDSEHPEKIGRAENGDYHAHTYKYVLPQAFRYDIESSGLRGTRFRCSFVALDRTSSPDSILAGEFFPPDGFPDRDARIARWDLDYRSRELRYDAPNVAFASAAYKTRTSGMQGAVAVGDRFYISRSRRESWGELLVSEIGGEVWSYEMEYTKPQDVYYGRRADVLWTHNETLGSRKYGYTSLSDSPGT